MDEQLNDSGLMGVFPSYCRARAQDILDAPICIWSEPGAALFQIPKVTPRIKVGLREQVFSSPGSDSLWLFHLVVRVVQNTSLPGEPVRERFLGILYANAAVINPTGEGTFYNSVHSSGHQPVYDAPSLLIEGECFGPFLQWCRKRLVTGFELCMTEQQYGERRVRVCSAEEALRLERDSKVLWSVPVRESNPPAWMGARSQAVSPEEV